MKIGPALIVVGFLVLLFVSWPLGLGCIIGGAIVAAWERRPDVRREAETDLIRLHELRTRGLIDQAEYEQRAAGLRPAARPQQAGANPMGLPAPPRKTVDSGPEPTRWGEPKPEPARPHWPED